MNFMFMLVKLCQTGMLNYHIFKIQEPKCMLRRKANLFNNKYHFFGIIFRSFYLFIYFFEVIISIYNAYTILILATGS